MFKVLFCTFLSIKYRRYWDLIESKPPKKGSNKERIIKQEQEKPLNLDRYCIRNPFLVLISDQCTCTFKRIFAGPICPSCFHMSNQSKYDRAFSYLDTQSIFGFLPLLVPYHWLCLPLGSPLVIFFQFSIKSFISQNNLAAL
jgi:hypothetical protein